MHLYVYKVNISSLPDRIFLYLNEKVGAKNLDTCQVQMLLYVYKMTVYWYFQLAVKTADAMDIL